VQHSHVWPCVAHVLFVHAFTHRFAPVNATTSVFFDETNKQVCVACVCVCARAIHSSSSCAMCWPLRAVALCSPPLFISLAHTMCVCACACCVFQTLASSAHSHTCTHIHWCAHKHNQCSCNTSYVAQDVGTSTPFVNGMPIALILLVIPTTTFVFAAQVFVVQDGSPDLLVKSLETFEEESVPCVTSHCSSLTVTVSLSHSLPHLYITLLNSH
jgi:hypothetical protein